MKIKVIQKNKTLPIGSIAEVKGEDTFMKQYRVIFEGKYYNLYIKDVEVIKDIKNKPIRKRPPEPIPEELKHLWPDEIEENTSVNEMIKASLPIEVVALPEVKEEKIVRQTTQKDWLNKSVIKKTKKRKKRDVRKN